MRVLRRSELCREGTHAHDKFWAEGHTGGRAPTAFFKAAGVAKPRLTSGGEAAARSRGCRSDLPSARGDEFPVASSHELPVASDEEFPAARGEEFPAAVRQRISGGEPRRVPGDERRRDPGGVPLLHACPGFHIPRPWCSLTWRAFALIFREFGYGPCLLPSGDYWSVLSSVRRRSVHAGKRDTRKSPTR